ncbi:MAG: TRAP transporter TatT component family protein, partial [Burkholderiales bacterium]
IKAAAPFSLKLMESLLAESPRHRGLLLAAASGFTQYAYAFVQQDAEEIEATDVAASLVMRNRARRLYLRARDYAMRGLEVAHPGFAVALHADAPAAVARLGKDDAPLAYWAAASWVAAIAIIKNDAALISELPLVDALAGRALAVDEAWDHGAIQAFFVSYELARSGGTAAGARAHFARARELTGGAQAGPFVALAEGVAVAEQNRTEFESLLHTALAVDAGAHPQWRLANLMMQRRARWLLAHADDFVMPAKK